MVADSKRMLILRLQTLITSQGLASELVRTSRSGVVLKNSVCVGPRHDAWL